ncbi:MAG: hypothetical protein O2975_00680 [Proteobacteria bacterium]|nr:hypothetical protein [Pseudomonadota bacterium]
MNIAFVGFGEAAQAFVTGWKRETVPGLAIAAYDRQYPGRGVPAPA